MYEAACPISNIIKRDGSLVAYDRDRIAVAIMKAMASTGEGRRSDADQIALQVEEMLTGAYHQPEAIPTVEDVQDMVESALLTAGRPLTARAYIIYRHERARIRALRDSRIQAVDHVPYRKIYDVLLWNLDHGCASIADLNRTIADGHFPELVRACDRRYIHEVAAGAELLKDRLPEVRMVIVAGPSSSGKTTTTIKVSETLAGAGMKFKALGVDHYFFDLEHHPKDEFGDYDYETPQALDLELINLHLEQLLAGKTIHTPHYDFKTGTRTLNVHEMHLADDEILLLDSLHGLYEGMTSHVPAEKKFKLYIETLGQVRGPDRQFMRWADNRLMRRMIRDSWHRHLQPAATITHWHYVRRSELQYIIPFIDSADYLVNSAMPFELPLLKHRLYSYFPEAMEAYRDEPGRQDAYLRAKRLAEFLKPLQAVEDDSCVPPACLLREFIGGSQYEY